ncbi:hypothetical protein ACI2VR_21870 [Ralstonia nicotianae]|uniref:hypothetical protein n=2 Tax=Ralstonia pseudosolanacearum TaxID=1310165 RepID=UPI001E61960E|nr:hypothetical protein [Ralstonia pseudosolanacearum]
MNPRRVHELMRKHFPAVEAATRAWVNVADQDGLREEQLLKLLDEYVPAELLLVEVHRKVGGFLPKVDAIQFIGEYLSQGTIRICDRDFHGFVVVTVNGVATGWASSHPGGQ